MSSLLKAAVAAGAIVAGAAFYHFKKDPNEQEKSANDETNDETSSETEDKTEKLERLKAEGNELFKKRKFSEAAEVYTKCIEEGKDADPKFLATLHQNRAAANKQINADETEFILADLEKAIRLNKKYARAYYRRAQVLSKKNPERALSDYYVAMFLEPAFGPQCMEAIEEVSERAVDVFTIPWPNTGPLPITHAQVSTWLFKSPLDFVNSHFLRCWLAKSWNRKSSIERALKALAEHRFEEALLEVGEMIEEDKVEGLFFAARLVCMSGQIEKDDEKYSLAFDLLGISLSTTAVEARKLMEEAILKYGFRDEICLTTACTLLSDEENGQLVHDILNDTRLLRFFSHLPVMAQRPDQVFTMMTHLETLVLNMPKDDLDKACALLVLATASARFGSIEDAERYIAEAELCGMPIPLLVGLARLACRIREGNIERIKEECERILIIEPTCVEALIRKIAVGALRLKRSQCDDQRHELFEWIRNMRGTLQHPKIRPAISLFLRLSAEGVAARVIEQLEE